MWVNTGPDLDTCQQSAWFRAAQRSQLCSYSCFLFLIYALFLTKQTLVKLFSAVRTFTLGDETTPHHLAFLQMASDGVGSLSLNEAFLADHRYGAPQLETVSEAPSIQRYARVRAFITPKGLWWKEKRNKIERQLILCVMKNVIFEEQAHKRGNECLHPGRKRKLKQGCVHENDNRTLWCRRHNEENYYRGIAWGLWNHAHCFVKALKLYTQWSQLAGAKSKNKGDQGAEGKWVQGFKQKTRAAKPHPTHQNPHCAVNVYW